MLGLDIRVTLCSGQVFELLYVKTRQIGRLFPWGPNGYVYGVNTVEVTPFQRAVYSVVERIPRGRVTTYKLLAELIGCSSPRAVGQALRRNPFAPAVPCHRVIASDLRVGGFQGASGGKSVARKLGLLKQEGVLFKDGRLIDTSLLCSVSSLESP